MKDENDSRRREILSTLAGLELQIHLPVRASRDDRLRTLIPALLELECSNRAAKTIATCK